MLQWPCRSGKAKCTDLWQAVKKVAKQKGTTWLLWFEVQLHQPYLGVHSHFPGLLREPHAPFLQLKKKKKKKNQLTFFLPQIARTLRIWYSMTTCIQNRIFQFLKERKKEKNKTLALCHFFFPTPSFNDRALAHKTETALTLGSYGCKHHTCWSCRPP